VKLEAVISRELVCWCR